MKIAVISFSRQGYEFAQLLSGILEREGHTVLTVVKCAQVPESFPESLRVWTKQQFCGQDAIVFVGAAGIAVRAIAPFVCAKTEDPAVLVMDEQGRYCIPVLAGHIGGGNGLARFLSAATGSEAVVTTATDLYGKWAIDLFAKKNHLVITDMEKAKRVSAKIIAGNSVSMYLDSQVVLEQKLPEEVQVYSKKEIGEIYGEKSPDVVVGVRRYCGWEKALYLVPVQLTLGIGCRKNTSGKTVIDAVSRVLRTEGIFPESIERIASIDLKKQEQGLEECRKAYKCSAVFFDAKTLQEVPGNFSGSAFVEKVTGTDNVCERSAVCASGGTLVFGKKSENGVTVAAAARQVKLEI